MLKVHFTGLAAACLMLLSCSNDGSESLEKIEKEADADAAADGKVECALAGRTNFSRVCATERVLGPDGQLLVIRNPDGGFRRFIILGGGKGLAPADGFDENFKIRLLGKDMIEVASGDDLYRLPAAIKASSKPAD
jgi:hypothetical protein